MANSGGGSPTNVTVASILLLALVAIIVLVQAIRTLCSRSQDQGEQRPDAGADPQARKAQAAGPGLVARVYRRSDEWWPVCLSDFDDGEAVSVLPACMHYFHAACVGEWLRAHATCPLCRAAPATGGV